LAESPFFVNTYFFSLLYAYLGLDFKKRANTIFSVGMVFELHIISFKFGSGIIATITMQFNVSRN